MQDLRRIRLGLLEFFSCKDNVFFSESLKMACVLWTMFIITASQVVDYMFILQDEGDTFANIGMGFHKVVFNFTRVSSQTGQSK